MLLGQIAHGGMGVVYRARHRGLDRVVALKLLLAGEFSSPEFIGRFHREAAAAASLRHPGIVGVHEAGEVGGQPFLALEHVPGTTLAERVRERPLPPREAARYLRAVGEAVQHAHDHGLLRRDLKPANILLDLDDQPRVTDFGLAKRLDGSTDLTATGEMLGSPHYLSPEAALGDGQGLTPATEVYSLGATFYHLLTGRPPLLAGSLAETLAQVRDQPPVAPRLLNPAIPRDLETICLKCLEKAPGRRYATAREFADELGRWERGEPLRARPATPAERAAKWVRRQPARAALAGVVVLSATALTAGSLWFNFRLTAARDAAEQDRRRAEASPDGLLVATVDEGQRLRVWDADSGELLSASEPGEPVVFAAFAGADRLVFGGYDGPLRLLTLPAARGSVQELAARARLSAGHEIDGTGGLAPLPEATAAELFARLRAAAPADFQARPFAPAWHRQELARATAAGEKFALRFHELALARAAE